MEIWGFSLCEGGQLPTHRESITHLLGQVSAADRGGMDGWFFAEHHIDPRHSLTPSPNLLVAAASQVTTRIRLGNMVTVLPFHHPLRVAEEIRLLDALTNGRLEVGVGRGGIPHEQAAWGVDGSEVSAMLTEGMQLLQRLLTEETIDYSTTWWTGRAVTVVPEPTQEPHPPMWIAAVSDESVEWAARLGFNCSASFGYPELLAERLARYGACWERHHPGTEPGRFGALATVIVAETEQEAIRQGKATVLEQYEHFRQLFAKSPAPAQRRIAQYLAGVSLDDLIRDGLAVLGSAEQCVEQVTSLQSKGVDVLIAWVQPAGLDRGFAEESLGRLCQAVIPQLEKFGRSTPREDGAGGDVLTPRVAEGYVDRGMVRTDGATRQRRRVTNGEAT